MASFQSHIEPSFTLNSVPESCFHLKLKSVQVSSFEVIGLLLGQVKQDTLA